MARLRVLCLAVILAAAQSSSAAADADSACPADVLQQARRFTTTI